MPNMQRRIGRGRDDTAVVQQPGVCEFSVAESAPKQYRLSLLSILPQADEANCSGDR